jgi:hypothetical protein
MSRERLEHIGSLLESGSSLPPSSAVWLRESIRRFRSGLPIADAFQVSPRNARRERDEIIRRNWVSIPGRSSSAVSEVLAKQARLIHRGRKTDFSWMIDAEQFARLPETSRAYRGIINGK